MPWQLTEGEDSCYPETSGKKAAGTNLIGAVHKPNAARHTVAGASRWQTEQAGLIGARDLLAPVRDRFTEGFYTPDLTDAMTLLDELS